MLHEFEGRKKTINLGYERIIFNMTKIIEVEE